MAQTQKRATLISGNNSLNAYELEGIKSSASALDEYLIYELSGINGAVTRELNNTFPLMIESVQAVSNSGTMEINHNSFPVVVSQDSSNLLVYPEIVVSNNSNLQINTSEDTDIRITTRRVAVRD